MSDYFEKIDAQGARIVAEKPATAERVIEILKEDSPDYSFGVAGDAFWGGGGPELMQALQEAGWRFLRVEAYYHWVARHPESKHTLGYVEGDVYGHVDLNTFFGGR